MAKAARLGDNEGLATGLEEIQKKQQLYLPESVEDKIRAVATQIYGADGIEIEAQALRDLRQIKGLGFTGLPICIAKTQSSLSDDPKLLGRPKDFVLTVRDVHINAGAGFLVVMTGSILRMPGLPRRPNAEHIDVEGDRIVGLR